MNTSKTWVRLDDGTVGTLGAFLEDGRLIARGPVNLHSSRTESGAVVAYFADEPNGPACAAGDHETCDGHGGYRIGKALWQSRTGQTVSIGARCLA